MSPASQQDPIELDPAASKTNSVGPYFPLRPNNIGPCRHHDLMTLAGSGSFKI